MNLYELLNRDVVCTCGRTHRCNIDAVCIESGALNKLPQLTKDYHHILIVADQNTYPLCGERVQRLITTEGICVFERNEILVPDERAIDELQAHLTDETDFLLGIGSGVINDLCKYVSFERRISCGIIASAPSMDGFASSGAAMILNGMKVTATTHAPRLILGDTELLTQAPMDMIRSGYADIIGKYSALNDWKLSALVNGEYLCPFVYDLVKKKTDEIRSLAGALTQRDPKAIEALTETLVLIGICLTLLSTTRPGSGSEHHLSHYFEITGLIDNAPYFLHGTDVGYATSVTARLRREILTLDTPSFQSLPRDLREQCYQSVYKSHWTEVRDLQQQAGRYDADVTPVYQTHWDAIRNVLAECPTEDEINEMLLEVGFDLSAFERMYGTEKIQRGIWFAKDLKDRYSVLWLYAQLFLTQETAEELQ